MATRSFLTSEDLQNAHPVLLPPMAPPSGDFLEGSPLPAGDFSSWLALNLESRLRRYPEWLASHPIAIGSWGRGELSVFSDLDVVFCGDETSVTTLLEKASADGITFKYRYAKNKADWRGEGDIFESNALFWARPFTPEAATQLQEQKKLLFDDKKNFRKRLLKALEAERTKRNQRHDSIANYLEPQLKFGPGGLRDIQQALMIWFWYPEKFHHYSDIFGALNQLKSFLLMTRQKMHLLGFNDALVAPAQFELYKWFGYKSQADFMKEVQKVLARVSFYCDLVFEVASKSVKAVEAGQNLSTPKDIFAALKKDPSVITQARVLHNISKPELKYSHEIKSLFNMEANEKTLRALFRSQLIADVLPEFRKVIGVVQHDQYHRYTVDAHIFQAVRQVRRVQQKPTYLGRLAKLTKTFKKEDWEILLWSALYHDLGKNRNKDHSLEGKQLAEHDLPQLGFSKAFTAEVAWIVENHLILSTSAFRKDPNSPQLWSELFNKGVHGERLRRLAIFTAIDIYATNPEAWTGWKEKLLFNLVQSIETPRGEKFLELKQKFDKAKLPAAWLERLDPGLLSALPSAVLIKDIKNMEAGKAEPVLVYGSQKEGQWVRFHNKKDQPGLFLQYVTRLWQSGLVIHNAYIHTLENCGVYDWFEVKTDKNLTLVKKTLADEVKVPEVKEGATLSEVSLIAESDSEWVFSFRGTDKKGVLMTAARALYDFGLQIRWAKIHTWGRQVDDVFGVAPAKTRPSFEWTQDLRKRLVEAT